MNQEINVMENQENIQQPVVTAVEEPVATTVVTPINQVSLKPKEPGMRGIVVAVLLLLIVGAGIGTGFGASKIIKSAPGTDTNISGAPGSLSADQVEVGKVYGNEDVKKYPDTSEGTIAKGGIDGEGSHHLLRAGGASQTVYLTSSALDLDLFIGDKVQIRGETFSAQKAAWFMDVISVKVIELGDPQTEASAEPVTE